MSEIKDLIAQLSKTKDEIYSCVCTVVEVNEGERVISVKPNNGNADVFDVRLQAVVSGAIGLVIFPKPESEVIINFISKELAFVALYSEIEKIELKIGSMSLFVDATDLKLENENTEIKSEKVDIESQTVKVVSTEFEVEGSAKVKLTAPLIDIIGAAINLTGAVTVGGSFSVGGAGSPQPSVLAGTVQMGTGSNGGIPKSTSLVTEFNKLKTDFQNLKAKFNAWSPVGGDGGAALKTQLTTWTPNVTPVTVPSISNTNATH